MTTLATAYLTVSEVRAFAPEVFKLVDEISHISTLYTPDFDFADLVYRAALALHHGEPLKVALAHLEPASTHPAYPYARELLGVAAARPSDRRPVMIQTPDQPCPIERIEAFIPELFELADAYADHSRFFGLDFDFDRLLYRAAGALERGDLDAALGHLQGTEAHPAAAEACQMLTAKSASMGTVQA